MTKKCDLCQRPIDWFDKMGTSDMYIHKPCNVCKWGIFGFLPRLKDHFIPKVAPPKLREIELLWCGKCGAFWWDYYETKCPDCKAPLKKLLMREVV